MILLDTHGGERVCNLLGREHKASRINRCTNRQRRSGGGQAFTQLHVLVISEKQNDVGSDVAHVAVPLETGPGPVSRQVSGALSQREESQQNQHKEKRGRGQEPPARHDGNLESRPQSFVSHTGVCSFKAA